MAPANDQTAPHSTTLRVARDEEIVAQDDPSLYCYLIDSGCVRTVRFMEDGRRQIGEFLFAGDVFGWEARGTHEFGAEAVTAVAVRQFRHDGLDRLMGQNGQFARKMRELAARQVRAGREHMLLLGRKYASERIASFLLDMADRLRPDARARVKLPMSRGDIADYLGLTIETVCRQLTLLRHSGTISVEQSNIVIADRRRLETASHAKICALA